MPLIVDHDQRIDQFPAGGISAAAYNPFITRSGSCNISGIAGKDIICSDIPPVIIIFILLPRHCPADEHISINAACSSHAHDIQ